MNIVLIGSIAETGDSSRKWGIFKPHTTTDAQTSNWCFARINARRKDSLWLRSGGSGDGVRTSMDDGD